MGIVPIRFCLVIFIFLSRAISYLERGKFCLTYSPKSISSAFFFGRTWSCCLNICIWRDLFLLIFLIFCSLSRHQIAVKSTAVLFCTMTSTIPVLQQYYFRLNTSNIYAKLQIRSCNEFCRFRSSAMIVTLGAKRSFTFLGTSAVTVIRITPGWLAADQSSWSSVRIW